MEGWQPHLAPREKWFKREIMFEPTVQCFWRERWKNAWIIIIESVGVAEN